MGTKEKPGQFDCYEKAEPDEPMFVLLARDPLAAPLVRAWAAARECMAVDQSDIDKAEEALRCADEMKEWLSYHPDHGIIARARDKRR